MDVRYQECRTFILDTLCDFVKKSGLDGLKLDFIDSFCLKDNSPKANKKMDEPDLALAVIRLLTDLSTRLESLCPNALIEFRQNYIGPAITRFGNMLRVGDCAFDSNLNRRRLADLRLLQYPIAIHSDMLYWAQDETNENIARQLLSVLYSVPQISVLLTKANEDQKTIIQNFLHYWTENRDILLHSNFKGIHQEMGYPILEAWNEEKHIITLYASMPIRITGTYDIWNATEENVIFVELTREHEAILYDVLGKEISRQKMYPGYQTIALPVGGRIELKS